MDTAALRSALQFACGSSLSNLTAAALAEGKWITNKQVLLALFAAAPLLQEHHNALLDLQEARNEEVAALKSAGAAKDVRLEAEQRFRTSFLRIAAEGLTVLRWPRATEAFADPVALLFSEQTAVLEAMEFVLRVGVPAAAPFVPSKQKNSPASASGGSSASRPQSSRRRSTDAFEAAPPAHSAADGDGDGDKSSFDFSYSQSDAAGAAASGGYGIEVSSLSEPQQPSLRQHKGKPKLRCVHFVALNDHNTQLQCRLHN